MPCSHRRRVNPVGPYDMHDRCRGADARRAGDDVTHDAAPRIDPRFDPRFQRGYTPDAADGQAPVDATDRWGGADAEDAADRVRAAPPAPAAARAGSPDAVERTPPLSERPPEPVVAEAPVPEGSDSSHPEDEAAATSATRWLWIALASCAAFTVVGALLYWNLANDQQRFMGAIGTPSEEAFRLFASVLSPALVQAGVVGMVIVLAVWVVRDGRRGGSTP
jgi:hypothetical protein